MALTPALPVVVNSTADNSDANPGDGACDTGGTNSEGDPRCTLRAAIQEANASTTINRIDFDIPATEAGYEPSPLAFRIQPSGSVLPNITDPVVIDGSTQPEFVGAGRPVIVLDGAAAPMSGDPNGLSLNAGNSTIRGLVIQNFGEDGIEVDVNGNNLIAGNYIGTDVTGTVARPNGTMDVAPVGGISIKTDGNTIGGPSAADRNIISGNTQLGLGLRDGATNNVVLGNHIGTDAAGTGAIPNAGQGIWIDGTSGNNTIGGPGAGEGNLISGNNATNTAASAGIYVLSSGNVIQGNRIGTDVAGTANLENNGPGVALTGSAADNLIGGTAAGEGNVIGFNKGDGVRLFSAAGSGNSVLGNSIFASEDPGLGIDLKNDAVTANDAGDGDSGVNGLLNYPVITSADESGGTVTVTFDLDVPANPDQYRIEFFTNPSGVDASGYGEAEIFAGAVTTGPGSGLTHAFAGSAGDVITATATRIDTGATTGFSSTSEISAIAVATSGPCADSDGDGLCDLEEDANLDADGDPATNPGPDTDGDTTPNHLDADDDGDGTPTASENADPNGDGDPRDARDADRDGQPDYLDDPTTASDGTVATEQKISETSGGFGGGLTTNDHFGRSVAGIGDIDGDGIADIAVGAPWDDDGSSDRGAIHVLFLNADGTVKAEQKISDTAGGFAALLDNSDEFGIAVAGIGDLDGDLIGDIAVGAHQDDDGGGNFGAVYVLFLNADGTVKAEQKISATQGGLGGVLGTNDRFGSAIAGIGDLDGDGLNDIVVGAKDDDDGGVDQGAVYVLFLNADGTVKAQQKISESSGGLGPVLDTSDGFGIGVAGLGDIDGDGAGDIAVGAYWDDDGGTNRGAVHILRLDTDGTIKAQQKISDTQGGFGATLDSNDEFGLAVGGVGDLDLDGV
ncbi:MAG: CSLREA domain-containing protein, partial [Acidimicrobiales bacterium]